MAKTPPKLTAPENKPRDQPNCSVMGTTNTVRVAMDISGRADQLASIEAPKIIQP